MNTSEVDAETLSAQQGERVEQIMPGLVRAAGWDAVGQLSEVTCSGSPVPEEASRSTRWSAVAGRSNGDQQEANGIAAAVQGHAEDTGWSTQQVSSANDGRVYQAVKDDMGLNLTYRTTAGRPRIRLEVTTSCLDMPEGHTMTRSEYDPMYGSNDPLYPHDDRSQFTNGRPKPFPEPSGTGSEGSSP